MRHLYYFWKKRKSLKFENSNSNSTSGRTNVIFGRKAPIRYSLGTHEKEKFKIFSIRIRIRIDEAPMLF